jgi:uncharacterized membrane protein
MKNTVSWFGTLSSVIGSFILALGFVFPGYIAFLCGAVSWLTIGVIGKDKPLIVLNSSFLAANLIGLYNAIY